MDNEDLAVGWLVVALAAGTVKADNASKKPTKPARVVIFKVLPPEIKLMVV
jgi:hypothetical protein